MQIEIIDDNCIDDEGNPLTYVMIRHDPLSERHPEVAEALETEEGIKSLLELGAITNIPSIEICSYVTKPNSPPIKEQSIFMPPDTLFALWKAYDNFDLKCMCNGQYEQRVGERVAIAPDSLEVGDHNNRDPKDPKVRWHVYTLNVNSKGGILGGRRVGKCRSKEDALRLARAIQELVMWEDEGDL